MKKIKFATAILNFSEKKGGAEKYIADLCARMVSENYEVHVYAENWAKDTPGIHFHRVKTIPFPKSLRLLSFAMRATKEIEHGDFDICFGVGNTLNANVLQPHGGVHWAWFWRSLKAYDDPVVRTIKLMGRVLSLKQWVGGYIEDSPYRARNLSRVIAISEMVMEDMMRWYRIPAGRITVVYNGVDIERFHPRNRRYREEIRKRHGIGNELVLLFVSNNFRMKGLRFLVQVLAGMKKETDLPFRLLILGRDRKERYLGWVRELGISEEVIFVGPTEEIEKYYGAADLLLHPSFYDACSLTVLEGLASGLPVITTSFNGASGIITQGQEGFVISDPRDRQALGQKISFFINPDARERASAAARRLAESYSTEKNWQEMRQIFEEVASGVRSTA